MRSYNRGRGRICTEEEKDVSIIEGKEKRNA